MKLADLDERPIARALRTSGLKFSIGPFAISLRSKLGYVANSVHRLYNDYERLEDDRFCDFHVAVDAPLGLRRIMGRQAQFYADGEAPFKPLPFNQAYPFFEWGLNWCIAQYAHQYLILHSAVVEKGGVAVVLPGNPGAGKSTLCAALVASGWRLLSDEMALIPAADNHIVPVPRPVALKNDSIDIIRNFAPDAVIGDSFYDTAKGTIAHMRPPTSSVAGADRTARPGLVIFPRFDAHSESVMQPVSRARAFLRVVEYAFNYDYLGTDGVRRMQRLIETSECYDFSYPSLDAALDGFHQVWEKAVRKGPLDG